VGLELFVSSGSTILAELQRRQKGIFLDLKFHDIPNTMEGACAAAASYGVQWLTVHASAGREALKRSRLSLEETTQKLNLPCPHLLAVTLLTSLNSRDLAFDLKVSLDLLDYVQQMALMAQESGATGVVCSPQEIAAVRQVCDSPFQVICPGIRPAWATAGDQRRTLSPAAAIVAGADYLVIGRPITEDPNPAGAFQRLCDELV
jgi:orotidine-5'-phosphate decarboxylase